MVGNNHVGHASCSGAARRSQKVPLQHAGLRVLNVCGHLLRGRVGKSDEVKTTDSVIIHLIWPIEELDIRSMSL